jgi:ribosomal-protein-serine acetyltransferase
MFPASIPLTVSPSIRLESLCDAHAEALLALIQGNIAHIRKYLPEVTEINSLEAAQAHVRRAQDLTAQAALIEWCMFANDRLCGSMRLNYVDHENRKIELAYFLGAEFLGRGIVTQAARVVIAYAFETLGFRRIHLQCATDNHPSIRVAERLGFTCEQELHRFEELEHGWVNHYIYGLMRDQWQPES